MKVKDDYKNSDWLKHQYYELGRSVQDIAEEQGVSMITIRNWIDISEEDKQKTIKIQTVKSQRKSSGSAIGKKRGSNKMKSEYKLALGIIFIFIISVGLLGGAIIHALFERGSFEAYLIGFGVLLVLISFFGYFGIPLLLEIISSFFQSKKPRKSSSKDPFWSQGNVYEKRERLEVKDDYKNSDWLKHQYYELGRSVQDIAEEQGVSMITIRKWLDKLEKR